MQMPEQFLMCFLYKYFEEENDV